MTIEVYGFIVTHFPYCVFQISNVNSPDMRKLLLNMEEGDILNIKGLKPLRVTDFQVKKRAHKGNELRELYIVTMPV